MPVAPKPVRTKPGQTQPQNEYDYQPMTLDAPTTKPGKTTGLMGLPADFQQRRDAALQRHRAVRGATGTSGVNEAGERWSVGPGGNVRVGNSYYGGAGQAWAARRNSGDFTGGFGDFAADLGADHQYGNDPRYRPGLMGAAVNKNLPLSGSGTTPNAPPNLPQVGQISGDQGTPSSVATGANPGIETYVPGSFGPAGQQRADDYGNFLLDQLYLRDQQLGGGAGPYGNNIRSDGSYNVPDWVTNAGLLAEWQRGANTDPRERQVQENETVAGQLSSLSNRNSALSRIAQQDAREAAAASGFLGGSSIAEGAALRESRAAMLPVAQQDANTYAGTAAQNMDAVNRDRLADQDAQTGLIGQQQGIRANLYENASDRMWRSREANQERVFQTMQSATDWLRASTDREDRQGWDSWQNSLQRDWNTWSQNSAQNFQGNQAEFARAQERSMAYFNQTFGREGMLAQTLNAIYGNTNLTPQQQADAARNASELYRGMWNSFNATLSQGIPEIFRAPYSMGVTNTSQTPSGPTPGPNSGAQPPQSPSNPPGTTPQTPAQPPAGMNLPPNAPPYPGDPPNRAEDPMAYQEWIRNTARFAQWRNSLSPEQRAEYGIG